MVESKQQWKAWLYLAPAIVLLLVFTVWPIINTVVMAFMGIPCTWIDYVTVAIFAIFIGYDVHVGATIEPNICNAFVVATNIFLDIVNIFLTLLDIFNND